MSRQREREMRTIYRRKNRSWRRKLYMEVEENVNRKVMAETVDVNREVTTETVELKKDAWEKRRSKRIKSSRGRRGCDRDAGS